MGIRKSTNVRTIGHRRVPVVLLSGGKESCNFFAFESKLESRAATRVSLKY